MSKIEVNTVAPQCGTTLTLGASGDTVTIPAGATISNLGTAAGFGSTGEVSWNTTVKTADFTATSGSGFFVNTAGGAVTVTLPSSPSAGNVVAISSYNNSASTNTITVARNGSNILGAASDFIITKGNSAVQFIYVDGTVGWQTAFTGSPTDSQSAFISATGGTVTESGDYKIHTFTGPGTFTVSNAGTTAGSNTVDYLVVAGGGGGGASDCSDGSGGGGGGAGGYRESSGAASGSYSISPLGACVSALPVTAQGYPIVVGGGGAAGVKSANPNAGANGSNSSFSTITSTAGGGGGGGASTDPSGKPGGSGGGAGNSSGSGTAGNGNTPPVSPAQGKNGGTITPPGTAPGFASAGGGGATAIGANGTNTAGGAGGAGATSSINGTPTARAGGGGGALYCGPVGGAGGSGGGGAGGGNPGGTASVAGTANTGGGGGGRSRNCGSAGGSGIVIIRYKFQ